MIVRTLLLVCILNLPLQTLLPLWSTSARPAVAVNIETSHANSFSGPFLLPPDERGKVETKYDGFKGETLVVLRKMRITCGNAKGLQGAVNDTCISFAASLHCPGVQLDHVQFAELQLIFETKDWDRRHALDERDLVVVADGEQFKLGRMSLAKTGVDQAQLLDVMREVFEVPVSYGVFARIARADTVEMKVGQTVFKLQPNNLEALRDLVNRVKY